MKFGVNDIIVHQNDLDRDTPTFWVVQDIEELTKNALGRLSMGMTHFYQCGQLRGCQNTYLAIFNIDENLWLSARESIIQERFPEFLI